MASAEVLERIYRLEVQANQAVRQLTRVNKSAKKIDTGFVGIGKAARAAFSVLAAFRGLRGIVEAADQLTLLQGSLEALTGSAARAEDLYRRVLGTVSETGTSVKDAATTFQRLTIGLEELGATNAQIETVAQTFLKLGRVSGTSIADTNAALVQFSQGLASGALQGDELRSIMERLPLITKLIQEEWNKVNEGYKISRGDVKQLGREGKLSAELIFNALISGSKLTAEQFEKLTFTLEQETNKLAAQFLILQATFSDETGFGEGIKDAVRGIASSMAEITRQLPQFLKDMKSMALILRDVADASERLAYVLGVLMVGAALKFSRALAAFTVAHPLIAFLSLVAVGALKALKEWDRFSLFLEFRMPQAFYELEVSALTALRNVSIVTQRFFNTLLKDFADYSRSLIIDTNAFIAIANLAPGISLPDLPVPEVTEFGTVVVHFTEEIANAQRKATDVSLKYNLGLAAVADNARSAAGELEKLQGQVKAAKFANARELSSINVSVPDDVAALTETILNALDPTRELNQEIDNVRTAILLWGDVSEESGEAYIRMLRKAAAETSKSTDEITEAMKRVKSAVDGFARDFTNTLVDGLKAGEFAFKDFAINVIATLTKMLLNPVFEQLFGILAGGIRSSFGIAPSGGVSSFGVAALASPSSDPSSIGILSAPSYGFGSGYSAAKDAGVVINVVNNSQAEVQATSKNKNGGVEIELLIQDQINASINNGGLDRSLQNNFGVRRLGF